MRRSFLLHRRRRNVEHIIVIKMCSWRGESRLGMSWNDRCVMYCVSFFRVWSSFDQRWSPCKVTYALIVCNLTNSSATAEIARDVWNGHSRSLKVICCCANRRGIYDFLLVPNGNFTSIFNRSWDIKPSLQVWCLNCYTPALLCTSIPHLSSRWNWKKTAWSRWACFGVRVDYRTINSNPRWRAPYDQNARPSQTDRRTYRKTDRQTDEQLWYWQ